METQTARNNFKNNLKTAWKNNLGYETWLSKRRGKLPLFLNENTM